MTSPGLVECSRLRMALRVPLSTVVTTGLGILAHLAGGGRPPGAAALVVLLTLITLLWKVMARVEQSLLRLLGGVVWVQVGIHFTLSQGHVTSTTATDGCAESAGAPGLPPHGTATSAVTSAAGDAMHSGGWMWLAHGVAALGVAYWLRRGEAACWRALRRVVMRLLPAVRAVGIPHRDAKTWVDDAGDARLDPPPVLLGHRWRGPPAHLTRPHFG